MAAEYDDLTLACPTIQRALKAACIPGNLGPYILDGCPAKSFLGSGFTTSVYRVRDTKTGKCYAARFTPDGLSAAWDMQIFAIAAERLKNHNVVPEFKGRYYLCNNRWLVIVMTLLKPIPRNMPGIHGRYAASMRRCLKKFHEANLVHGDVHIDNFMIDPSTDTARIIDFGLSYDYKNSATSCFLPKIPRGKRFPEVKDWSWITSKINYGSISSLHKADILLDTTKLEIIIDQMSL